MSEPVRTLIAGEPEDVYRDGDEVIVSGHLRIYADLAAELTAQIEKHSAWWPVDVPAAELATAMIPMHDTPLGELAADLTLRQIGLRDRLCEMEFEADGCAPRLRRRGGNKHQHRRTDQ